MLMFVISLLVLGFLKGGESSFVEEKVTVTTPLGDITGLKVTNDDGEIVYKFLGIPYAKPPVGELRFKPPQPVEAYGSLEATVFGPSCPQFGPTGVIGEEDCLYLNIYTNTLPNIDDAGELKPIMFFVHGGGGVSGAGDMYDPTPLLREDVIVITTNYRLGTLGFLNFGNDIVSGNMVIRDLLEGLKWSKNNIEFFGGDASRTIAFGQSAGSMLTHALHLTTKSEGLLSGAIAQSGSVPMASTKSDEGRTAAEIALYLNCTDIAIDEAMLDCLQQVSFQDIVIETTPTGEVLTEDDIKYDWTNFLLAQDEYSSDPLFPVNPVLALKNGVFNKVPLMIGSVIHDGALFTLLYSDMEAQWREGSAVLVNVAASFNKSEMTLNEKVLAEIVLHYYTGDSLVIKDSLEELSMMFNDASYRGPSYESLKLASEYAPTYSFIYNYKGSETYMEDFILMLGTDPDPDIVSRFRALTPTHGDDLLPIFNLKGERTDEDLVMSSLMTRYWTNFAKFGNPSPEEDTALPRWMPFNMAQGNGGMTC